MPRRSFDCKMSLRHVALRYTRSLRPNVRFVSSTPRLLSKERQHENVDEHRKFQQEKPLTPHMTNTNSTISNEFPSLGSDKPPPDLLTAVDPDYNPQDAVPENTERMTGGTQEAKPAPNAELDVGQMEGAEFKVEPMRRTGEDNSTMRARLLCPSRMSGAQFSRSTC